MDGDVFGPPYGKGWRPVAAAIREDQPVADVADRIETCLVKHLRRQCGLFDPLLRQHLPAGLEQPDVETIARALRRLVYERVLGRVLPSLVGEYFDTLSAAESFMDDCLASAGLPHHAASLARRPDAHALRRRARKHQDLRALLDAVAPTPAPGHAHDEW